MEFIEKLRNLSFDEEYPFSFLDSVPIWVSLLILIPIVVLTFRFFIALCQRFNVLLSSFGIVLLVFGLFPVHLYMYSFCGNSPGGTSIWMPFLFAGVLGEGSRTELYQYFQACILAVLFLFAFLPLFPRAPWVSSVLASGILVGISLWFDPEPETLSYEIDKGITFLRTGVGCRSNDSCCYSQSALVENNPWICLKMRDKSLQSECLIHLAGTVTDKTEDCLVFGEAWEQLREFGEMGAQLRASGASIRDLCLRALALHTNTSHCARIENSVFRELCFSSDVKRYQKLTWGGPTSSCFITPELYFNPERIELQHIKKM